jgi:N-acylneuraminate cytidylyltransferase
MNAAIITARAGSKSIRDKNTFMVRGKPLVAYPIQAARDAKHISKIFISTDGESIANVGTEYGCEIIWRPEELCGDHVNHGEVIKHAVEWVDAKYPALENVVLLLGNTVMVDGALIDASLEILRTDAHADSAISVWEAADDHPLRALQIKDGLVKPYGDENRQVSTERQSYPKAYYYDQGVWTFRKECVQRRDGPNPWWWMGKNVVPIVRNWVTGRDIHTHLDLSFSDWWLQQYPGIKEL